MKYLNTGLYSFELAQFPSFALDTLASIYVDAPTPTVWDYRISIAPSSHLRRWLGRDVVFRHDMQAPFKPLPREQSYPLLEWGMNWVIAAHDYQHLIIHSSVLVKDGKAILFPASPGSGKSTLTTYLGLSGWQVFSDEMAIIDMQTLQVKPLYRPACIKNQSIDLVKSWFPDAQMTPVCHDTAKGSVAHVKIHDWKRYKTFEPSKIAGIVFPQYQSGAELTLYTLSQLQVFQAFTEHAFNYHVLGQAGFEVAGKIVKSVKSFEVHYSNLSFMHDFLTEEVLYA